MRLKYVVQPGYIVVADGDMQYDLHWIGAAQLMRLYGVHERECVVLRPGMPKMDLGLIALRPRMDGNYTLPERK